MKLEQKPPDTLETLENMLRLIRPEIKRLRESVFLNNKDKKTLDDLIKKEEAVIKEINKLKGQSQK